MVNKHYRKAKNRQLARIRYNKTNALDKGRIAEAVQKAVLFWRKGNDFGGCLYYALAGSVLLHHLAGMPFIPIVGTFGIQPDPDDEAGIFCDAEKGGIDQGEFHAWIGTSDTLIDFSARHYPSMTNKYDMEYKRPVLPYLWCQVKDKPPWLHFRCNEEQTKDMLVRNKDVVRQIGRLAIEYYHNPDLAVIDISECAPAMMKEMMQWGVQIIV